MLHQPFGFDRIVHHAPFRFAIMAFLAFSFHFVSAADQKKAKVAVTTECEAKLKARSHEAGAKNDIGAKARGEGIVPGSLTFLSDGFYVRWVKHTHCIAARSWLIRVLPEQDLKQTALTICAHTGEAAPVVDPFPMQRLTKDESASRIPFYAALVEVPATATGSQADTPSVLAKVSAAPCIHQPGSSSRTAPVVTAPFGARQIINSPSSCWSLALAARCSTLKLRANHYTMGSILGDGTFGDVFKATFRKGDMVTSDICVKRIKKDTVSGEAVRVEVYALERCNDACASVVRLLDVFVRSSEPRFHLVLELWDTNLFRFCADSTATPLQIRSAMRGPMEGLRFLHDSLQLVHADIKPQNILVRVRPTSGLEDLVAVLGDLGAVLQVLIFS